MRSLRRLATLATGLMLACLAKNVETPDTVFPHTDYGVAAAYTAQKRASKDTTEFLFPPMVFLATNRRDPSILYR
jgi:hypothetical protein